MVKKPDKMFFYLLYLLWFSVGTADLVLTGFSLRSWVILIAGFLAFYFELKKRRQALS